MRYSASRSFGRFLLSTVLVVAAVPRVAAAAEGAAGSAWGKLRDGDVVLMRHADAPGVGDPAGFRLGDCRTQRNLDERGRAQARAIGASFRRHAVKIGAVVSSQWCRTHETAELAFPGQVRDDARFNSFFGDPSQEAGQTATALAGLREWHGPGALVVVTHQVNITALTGVVPASGEAVVVRPEGSGLAVVGRLPS